MTGSLVHDWILIGAWLDPVKLGTVILYMQRKNMVLVAAQFENLEGYEMNVPNGFSKIGKTNVCQTLTILRGSTKVLVFISISLQVKPNICHLKLLIIKSSPGYF